MHTIWKGSISFGLVNVPVKLFAATEEKDISMRQIHTVCGTPISYVRTCRHCNIEVDNEDISRGYEYETGRFVLFEKDELESLAGERSRDIKIMDFVNLTDIDPIYFQKTYYLGPGDTGVGAYSLLYAALKKTGKIGIATVSIRNKSSLAAIRLIDDSLAMETIYYPDEIRDANTVPGLPRSMDVNEKELQMAEMLIEHLSTSFDPEKYQDEYRGRVQEAINKKVSGEDIRISPEAPRTNVIDLMAALQASLEAVNVPSDKGKRGASRKKKESGTTAG